MRVERSNTGNPPRRPSREGNCYLAWPEQSMEIIKSLSLNTLSPYFLFLDHLFFTVCSERGAA